MVKLDCENLVGPPGFEPGITRGLAPTGLLIMLPVGASQAEHPTRLDYGPCIVDVLYLRGFLFVSLCVIV